MFHIYVWRQLKLLGTALMIACYHNKIEDVNLLLKQKEIDLNCQDVYSFSL